jgi:cation transport ATPase
MEEMEILLALHELDLWPIDHEITEREVKEKWKALMVAFHPDKLQTGTFKDGEKAKKINNAKDLIVDNIDAVNEFIRRKNGMNQDDNSNVNFDDIMKEFKDLEDELKRYEEKLKEEERLREEREKEEALRRYEEELREEERKKEKAWNKIVKFSIMGAALIMMILTLILADNSVDTTGAELRAMSICSTLPIVILTLIPATRKKLFSLFVNAFLLFVVFIFFLASLGM